MRFFAKIAGGRAAQGFQRLYQNVMQRDKIVI
jgi:hypothetical protein